VLVGDIDDYHLNDLSRKTERYVNRKIRGMVLSREEFEAFSPRLQQRPHVIIWEARK